MTTTEIKFTAHSYAQAYANKLKKIVADYESGTINYEQAKERLTMWADSNRETLESLFELGLMGIDDAHELSTNTKMLNGFATMSIDEIKKERGK